MCEYIVENLGQTLGNVERPKGVIILATWVTIPEWDLEKGS